MNYFTANDFVPVVSKSEYTCRLDEADMELFVVYQGEEVEVVQSKDVGSGFIVLERADGTQICPPKSHYSMMVEIVQ